MGEYVVVSSIRQRAAEDMKQHVLGLDPMASLSQHHIHIDLEPQQTRYLKSPSCHVLRLVRLSATSS